MLVAFDKLMGAKVLSVQAGGPIANITDAIVDPNNLKIIAFYLNGGVVTDSNNVLDVSSIREYSRYGFVVDDAEELISVGDVVKISEIAKLNFSLIGLKVETKKGSKLGKVENFTLTQEDFVVQQLIVKRPTLKSLIDPELVISRNEIVEITDYKVIVKDEEKVIRERTNKEDFVPNFVNPFREQGFAPIDSQNPDELDTE